ncbi:hypothetical protein GYM69_10320 [Lactobacillus panisapium]|uniref:hypothetical protein n=1 Tax=Lactobacillus panisapium TaxID=2012495 RepID=UPI001C6A677C|nr:hypothetical protein [Lactobacillus panisapium]QYN57494.1 hypothetical protein GYM69_10320 [Lactobacillus panisapium]
MNKKYSFTIYAVISALIILLARQNWNTVYLKLPQLVQASFGWIRSPMKLALISANNFVFDYVTIILPRMERNSIESFIIVRKPKLQALIRGLAPKEYSYLLLFVIVHLTAFDISNLISSLLILLVMIIVWLVLVFVMTYRLSVVKQNVLVFLFLLGLRTVIFSLNL